MRLSLLAIPVALLAFAVPAVAQASITLSTKSNFAVKLPAPTSAVDIYDVGEDATGFCKGGFPIAAGWTGTQTIVSSIVYRTGDNPYFSLDLRRPMTAGSFKAISLCAKGKGLGATVKTGSGQTVSCGKKLAIGIPAASTWPYEESPIVAEPNGPKGWRYVQTRGTPSAVCVNASAFGKVKVVKKTARFAVGSNVVTFSATCPGGRRAIGWGYSADVMDQNVWESADTDSKVAVPFVSASMPNGTGWKLTFTTPDQKAAKTAGSVGLNVTCAVPQ